MLWLEVVGTGNLEVGYLEARHLMRLALAIYLAFSGWSWFGNNKSGTSPDHSGLVPAEVWVRVSQFTCGPIIVCLHIWTQSSFRIICLLVRSWRIQGSLEIQIFATLRSIVQSSLWPTVPWGLFNLSVISSWRSCDLCRSISDPGENAVDQYHDHYDKNKNN